MATTPILPQQIFALSADGKYSAPTALSYLVSTSANNVLSADANGLFVAEGASNFTTITTGLGTTGNTISFGYNDTAGVAQVSQTVAITSTALSFDVGTPGTTPPTMTVTVNGIASKALDVSALYVSLDAASSNYDSANYVLTITDTSGVVTTYSLASLVAVSVDGSIVGDGTTGGALQLAGDAVAPGNDYFYGTNASGAKGWQQLSAAVASQIYTGISIQGDASQGNPIILVNDAANPGNDYFYGTDATGTKGWQALPAALVTGGAKSIVFTASATTLELEGDKTAAQLLTTPSYYAYTPGSGKGWVAIPEVSTNSAGSIQGTGLAAAPFQLVGDDATLTGNTAYSYAGVTNLSGVLTPAWKPVLVGSTLVGNGIDVAFDVAGGAAPAVDGNYFYAVDVATGAPVYTWKPISSVTVKSLNSVQGDGTAGNEVQLVNDKVDADLVTSFSTAGNGSAVYGATITGGVVTRGWLAASIASNAVDTDGAGGLGSIVGDGLAATPIGLVNDQTDAQLTTIKGTASLAVYSFDGTTRGWAPLTIPTVITSNKAIVGDGSAATPIALAGDTGTYTAGTYYGTAVGGTTLGFFDLPTVNLAGGTSSGSSGDGTAASPLQLEGAGTSLPSAAGTYYYTYDQAAGTFSFQPVPVPVVYTADGTTIVGDGTTTPFALAGGAPVNSTYFGVNDTGVLGYYTLPAVLPYTGSGAINVALNDITLVGADVATAGQVYTYDGTAFAFANLPAPQVYSGTNAIGSTTTGSNTYFNLAGDTGSYAANTYYGLDSTGNTLGFYPLPKQTAAIGDSAAVGVPVDAVGAGIPLSGYGDTSAFLGKPDAWYKLIDPATGNPVVNGNGKAYLIPVFAAA